MKIKPIKQAKRPNYPTFEYYIEHPELLYKSIPESWLKNKCVAASLATFVLLGCSNSNSNSRIKHSSNFEIVNKFNSFVKERIAMEQQNSVKAAPIFVHGERLYKKRANMFIQKHYNAVYPILSMIEDMK
jgi:hypothetical protein